VQNYPIATIDLAALQYNLSRVKQLAPNSRVMSVIKANAYGHGAQEVAQALVESDAFAVARLSEAIRLREVGIVQPIVILEGVNTAADLRIAADLSLSLVFHHDTQIKLVTTIKLSRPLEFCWLMVETGMHRLGLSMAKVDTALRELSLSSNIRGEIGLMSHFANADVVDDARNVQQLANFAKSLGKKPIPTSMANSAAILSSPISHCDWLRPGLMLYGISPFESYSAQDLGLKPVMQLKSRITAIQELKQGEQVGYGGEWSAEKTTRVGIASIGYGDGYSRQLSNMGVVSINGEMAALIGRVSMDMIAIDISKLNNVAVGDEITLWGDEQLSVENVAKLANTIPYELVCQVSERVKREYLSGKA